MKTREEQVGVYVGEAAMVETRCLARGTWWVLERDKGSRRVEVRTFRFPS